MANTVALIGMGLLGSALAENLLAAGFAVRGYDVAPELKDSAAYSRAMNIKGERMLGAAPAAPAPLPHRPAR